MNNNNELTWTASGAGEQTSFLLTFVGNVSKREVTAAAGTTKLAIPADLAESRYLVEVRAVKNGTYSPPTDSLKIAMKGSSVPEDLTIVGLDDPQGIATAGEFLYIANRGSGEIIQADMDGKNAKTAIDKLATPMGIATDRTLIWVATQGSGGAITGYRTRDFSVAGKPVAGKQGINYLSYLSSTIYGIQSPLFFISGSKGWAAWGYDTMCSEIASELSGARGMTCDGTFFYIARWDQNKVLRVRIDKIDKPDSRDDFITVTKPEDISYNASHIYVTSDDGALIRASRHTGVVDDGFTIRNLSKPRGVAVWGNYVYFVEQGTNKVSRVLVRWAAE
ncbi:hypothetical protein [Streptomyces formicae]|uniref:Fibronectin type-III domain-containing protein n=1 Tax=Streptomyces formicae TaxID=1616117 RepID=A0ABY3WK98_9ACTN|nr:hypothetical protein [Streptomyces formicae]UNM13037.1 hypothetical protein J4032_17360 [Streptomyces formicae]